MKSIYLLFGDERFLIRLELERIKKLDPQSETETLEGVSARELAEKIFMPSLFAPRKTLIIHDFDFRDADENLAESFTRLPPGITLVFLSPQNLDKRTKFFKAFKDSAEMIECRKIPEWEVETIIGFLESQAAALGKKISKESAELLIEYAGFDLGTLSSEMEKLSIYSMGRGEIAREDIEKMVPRTGYDAFTVTEALRQKNRKKAFEALEKLFIDREDPIEFLGLISSQFRNLYKVKLLMKNRISDRYQIARQLKASPYYMGKTMAAAGNFKEEELMEAIDTLCLTDLHLKRGYDPKVELSLLLLELLGEKG